MQVQNPENPERLSVWPLPRSLATTGGISVDVFSCPYLDVSVQGVPLAYLFDSVYDTQVLPVCVPTFGNLRITAYLQLPEAYRSLSRPSSAPDAKAFPLRSFSLDLSQMFPFAFGSLELCRSSTEDVSQNCIYPISGTDLPICPD